MPPQINHDLVSRRFFTRVDGHEAELVYQLHDGRMTIDHTGMPGAIGGRGIAGELVMAALEYAINKGLRVLPACSYSARYIQRHPQYAYLVDH